MELETALRSRTIRTPAREASANPNHWYAIARTTHLKPGKILQAMFWNQPLAIFQDASRQIRVLDDACPHKGVSLHKGAIKGCHVVCPYHGWEFDGESGQCVAIPYLNKQKLPQVSVRSYPARERYGLIWFFPGDPLLASQKDIIEIPQFGDDDWLLVWLEARFYSHFSICNENAIDMFHGHLHKKYQAWNDTKLVSLQETSETIEVQYDVTYQNPVARWLGLSKWNESVSSGRVTIKYLYPHITSSLGGISRVYLLRLPVSDTESQSFGMFFTKTRIPKFLAPLKPLISYALNRFLLKKIIQQDIEMNEYEQRTYELDRDHRNIEVNPAVLAMQRLIVRQVEEYKSP